MDQITRAMEPSHCQPASSKKNQTRLTVDGDDVKVKKKNSVPDFLWELDQDQRDLLMDHFGLLFKFAKYDSCFIPLHKENDIHEIVYYLRWVFLVTVIALSSYHLHVLLRALFCGLFSKNGIDNCGAELDVSGGFVDHVLPPLDPQKLLH
ncbi:hypothetical protein L596_013457 [Steinernema carpocapsae]|uniref:Uncharacterized protein n=1 Tax=Steinernema carpocapsae TaxID=34508 RepID=A0A4V6A568_STECR|nr:hypothetical protein L596_013457 [Steinernema carpocapsae]